MLYKWVIEGQEINTQTSSLLDIIIIIIIIITGLSFFLAGEEERWR